MLSGIILVYCHDVLNQSTMKKILVLILAATLLVPCSMKASTVSSPVSTTVTDGNPVDELLSVMRTLMGVYKEVEKVGEDNITPQMMQQIMEILGQVNTLKEKYSDYRLTDADRAKLVDWVKYSVSLMGEEASAEEIRETRERFNSYQTFGEMLGEMFNGMQ